MSDNNLKLQDLETKQQIQTLLQWMQDNEDLRDLILNQPDEAFAQLATAGHQASADAQRQLLNQLKRNGFQITYQLYWPTDDSRGLSFEIPFAALPTPTLNQKTPEKIVSTGFSTPTKAAQPLNNHTPLTPNTQYYYWLEVGQRVEGSIEVVDTKLPIDKLPAEAHLQVVLFPFAGELITKPSVGHLQVMTDGTVRVAQPVARPNVEASLLQRRLFFPVSTAASTGSQRLRCNIYYQQTLVQSRLITVKVGPVINNETTLKAEVDYTLSKTLDGNQLAGLGQNRLSIMLNNNGTGTHGFRFFGEGEVQNDATLGEGSLQNLVETARGVMRQAAWGRKTAYQPGDQYRYTTGFNERRLLNDLISFASRGKRFYDSLIDSLVDDSWALEDLMIKPGQVQLASKESARLVVPIAMFYDYPLDDGSKKSAFSLCPSFVAATKSDLPLEATDCFLGNCPSRGQRTTICPSGFWGFRHQIGLPVSTHSAPDAPTTIPTSGTPKMAVSVSTDPAFRERPGHEQRLKAMGFDWEYATERDSALDLMKATEAQVVYFYCHGGLTSEKFPYISVGPKTGKRLTRSNLRDWRIRWRNVRPIVFINGCHTVALEPEAAIDLVSGFVVTSHAAGVIGTEITIFEPIAVAFGESFMYRFLQEKQPIGEAVRGARLEMLKAGNPLGLVYILYAVPGLKVV